MSAREMQSMQSDTVRSDDTILIQYSNGGTSILNARNTKKLNVLGNVIAHSVFVGAKYGDVFELKGKSLQKVEKFDDFESTFEEITDGTVSSDNRNLVDSHTAQILTQDDIQKMKDEGLSGKEIVESLKENSETFKSKTEFSQQKWLKRKSMKHIVRLRVLPVNSFSFCEFYASQNPQKGSTLRSDMLAHILGMANIHSNMSAMVFDTVMGVVISAVLQRVGTEGTVLAPYHKTTFNDNIFNNTNLSDCLKHRTLVRFHTSEAACINQMESKFEEEEKAMRVNARRIDPHEIETTIAEFKAYLVKKNCNEEEIEAKCISRRTALERRQMHASAEQTRQLLRDKVESLIIATRCDPLSSLKALLPFLLPSCPFVVYCEFQQPLVECYEWAKQNEELLNIDIVDYWCRSFQAGSTIESDIMNVLNGRTRPDMRMSGASGFCLSGIKVVNRKDERSHPPPMKRIRKRKSGQALNKRPKKAAHAANEEESNSGLNSGADLMNVEEEREAELRTRSSMAQSKKVDDGTAVEENTSSSASGGNFMCVVGGGETETTTRGWSELAHRVADSESVEEKKSRPATGALRGDLMNVEGRKAETTAWMSNSRSTKVAYTTEEVGRRSGQTSGANSMNVADLKEFEDLMNDAML